MIFREMTPADVPMTFLVRAAAKENPMPLVTGLKHLGITVESVKGHLATTHKGFVCEVDGLVIGFTIADNRTGELWVLSVWPEYEGKGIGRQLMLLAQEWLFSKGWEKLWLTTGVKPSRALALYQKLGWKITQTDPYNHRMELGKSL
jgi:ribosomal protein S18 acetylase RimI-like enzyme